MLYTEDKWEEIRRKGRNHFVLYESIIWTLVCVGVVALISIVRKPALISSLDGLQFLVMPKQIFWLIISVLLIFAAVCLLQLYVWYANERGHVRSRSE